MKTEGLRTLLEEWTRPWSVGYAGAGVGSAAPASGQRGTGQAGYRCVMLRNGCYRNVALGVERMYLLYGTELSGSFWIGTDRDKRGSTWLGNRDACRI